MSVLMTKEQADAYIHPKELSDMWQVATAFTEGRFDKKAIIKNHIEMHAASFNRALEKEKQNAK